VDGNAPRILIIDNSPHTAGTMKEYLESEGFRVEVSEGSGGAALWLAQTFKPWVVVARHDLPATDGLEACRLIKADTETSHVSFVLCSDVVNDGFMVRALEAGVNAFIAGVPSKDVLVAHVYAQLNVFQMVMELREKNHFLRDLVQRDPMTGLFNHAYLHEVLEREINRSRRTNSPVSLLLVDLDNFKKINDGHGHQTGDYCLKTAAEVLASGGRRSDFVARYGGDEFAVVLTDTNKAGAAARGEQLRQAMASRAFADRNLPGVTLSLGVATFPDDAADRTGLIAAADRAVYAAKRIGRNRVVAYGPELGSPDEMIPGAETGPEIERLLAINEFIAKKPVLFHYQPIVSAESGSIFAYEALCRPQHAAFETPLELFSTAERGGRVIELGKVLRELAIAPIGKLHEQIALFVNLHPLELSEDLVEEVMTAYGAHAHRLVLEITEAQQIHDYTRMRDIIASLQGAGFRVAVDDLGAGYAGLNSVALLRPDIVKLDMQLIRGIQHDTSAARLIRHMLDFAQGEGLLVVAEGVETAEERRVVTELGCPLLQGFHFARPGPAFPEVEALNAWLSSRKKRKPA
jgi:diguanylate cyclase (GGDEF)-like protein